MKENKKYSTAVIIFLILSSLGFLLMISSIFFESRKNLVVFGLGFLLNSIGGMFYTYSILSKKKNEVNK